ncbi:MAG TPA: lysophospholipid acyltransferase family protein [Solirubrobacteraceae bacterium]|nr:lysophospholipid acyltransferase family protein [Solirubrobacteraceae bacterium]
MAGTETTGASRNGHSHDREGVRSALGGEDEQAERDGAASLPERLIRAIGSQVSKRIPEANLDDRDPDSIRETLPGLWRLASLYFRGEVRGLGNIPEKGPVLLVGNHSGGNLTVDSGVFMLGFSAYFGVEREIYSLAHNLVVSMPGLGFLKRWGVVAASRDNARKALEDENALLVYPGGDYEVHRPVWERNKVDFDGRKGWIRTALEHDVPVVPVVAIGGQETSLFLSRGETLAKLLMLDRAFRLKVLPISLAIPWGLNVGDFLGHVPLPAKITIETLPPIRLREEFGEQPDLDEVYDHVLRLMQETLDALAAERRYPVIG